MTTNESSTASNATSWIISIAVSVVCCAVIFVVFASYITDVKKGVRENSDLINSIQAREVSIQQTLEIISKRLPAPAPATLAETPAVAPTQATTSSAITAPTIGAPVAEPATPAAPTITAPTIQAPVITPPAPASAVAPAVQTPSTSK